MAGRGNHEHLTREDLPVRLTRQEIVERMQSVAAELIGESDVEETQPRFISAAELVRRMRRFVVLN